MGYKSDVTLTIKNKDFNVLVEQTHEKGTYWKYIGCAELFQNENYTTLYWEWVNWRSTYDEVAFIENFMKDVPHVFHRQGEEADDYEYDSDFGSENDFGLDYCVSVVRGLDLDNAGEPIELE